MNRLLLLGDEAVAQAAIDAGISGVYAYPGTPSTEITEYIQSSDKAQKENIHHAWSANEKTAMEAAMGMSFCGKRSMVCMKHVGVNVAADPFMNSSISGIVGGLLFVAADDPSMHSSQNEQDSRFYGRFAMIPILEPSSQQEAYDMAYFGFELSEQLGLPVMLRITTRLAHSRSGVVRREERAQNVLHFSEDPRQFVLLPVNARQRYKKLLAAQQEMQALSEASSFNVFTPGRDLSKGIIACGIAYNYLMENFPGGCPYPVLRIGQYPLPKAVIAEMLQTCEQLMVLEEGYPLVEEMIGGLLNQGNKVTGRLSGSLPRDGERNPDIVAAAFGLKTNKSYEKPEVVLPRPPALCQGCGHRDMYDALNAAISEYGDRARVFGDIGCYTLGYLPPFRALHACLDMGASITMAKGAADAGLEYAVAVIGDSTFTHSGMTSLLDAVYEQTAITVIISDNEVAAMTGGQDSPGSGRLEAICAGLGVEPEHIRSLVPLKKTHDEMVKVIKEEINYPGVSVIIPRRACIHTLKRKKTASNEN
ncbi:MAG: indolepyruvate ferredoxin oxidoreductase [Bacteroidales bacterium]|nr:indolepyruvate ferredoxin oxidoreductase [Bacteroidales bacterium]